MKKEYIRPHTDWFTLNMANVLAVSDNPAGTGTTPEGEGGWITSDYEDEKASMW